jgi:hypothetical protein
MSGRSDEKQWSQREWDVYFILNLGKLLAGFDDKDALRWPSANEIGEQLIRIARREKKRDQVSEPRS